MTDIDNDDFHVAILACRPVGNAELAVLRTLLPGEALPPIYPGAVQDWCRGCGTAIWVGPRMQDVIKSGKPPACPMCYLCAVDTAGRIRRTYGFDPPVKDLGNPYGTQRVT